MLTAVVAFKALIEIALMFFIGRLVLALLAGPRRADNPVYRVFLILTQPVIGATRWLVPRIVLDRHVPIAAFVLLVCAWIALTAAKIYLMRIAPALGAG